MRLRYQKRKTPLKSPKIAENRRKSPKIAEIAENRFLGKTSGPLVKTEGVGAARGPGAPNLRCRDYLA